MTEKKQNIFMKWMIEKFAPAMTKFVAIPWVACIANTFTRLLPVILTGSLIFFYNVFRSYIPALPNLDPVKDFSFGFLSLFIAFMIPYNLLVAMVVGEVVAVIYYNWVRFHFFENSDKVPDFIVDWLNNIAPIFLILLFGYILIGVLGVDIVDVLSTIFSPISAISNTYIGFVLLILIPTILYSLGISSWAFGAVSNPIYFANIAANIAAVEAGGKALSIATSEATFTAALITLGGMGCTLVLVIMAALKGKSKKMKAMGRICLVPSIFNINEPVVYGFPIVFNPILMVPFWLCSIVGASIEYFVMKLGWLNIPSKMIQVGQIPAPFSSIMITEDMRAIIWWVVLLIVYWLIYWPFFKAYDKECLKQEAIEETGE